MESTSLQAENAKLNEEVERVKIKKDKDWVYHLSAVDRLQTQLDTANKRLGEYRELAESMEHSQYCSISETSCDCMVGKFRNIKEEEG